MGLMRFPAASVACTAWLMLPTVRLTPPVYVGPYARKLRTRSTPVGLLASYVYTCTRGGPSDATETTMLSELRIVEFKLAPVTTPDATLTPPVKFGPNG